MSRKTRRRRFLFVMQYPGYLRYFDSTVRGLAARGHHVDVVFDNPHKQAEGAEALAGVPGVELHSNRPLPPRDHVWDYVARAVRGTLDYVRYYHPKFADATYLRDRMRKVVPRELGFLARRNTSTVWMTQTLVSALTLCERDTNGTWQVVRNTLLPFTEFQELQSVGLGAQKPNTIAFFGANAVGWMSLTGDNWEFTELDGYETPIKDGHLHDVVSGDLNQDGRKDLVFLETGKNYLDLVIFDRDRKLVPANRWQVFEERTFRGRRSLSRSARRSTSDRCTAPISRRAP